jgi:hypothetical protein
MAPSRRDPRAARARKGPDFSALPDCVEEARRAALDDDAGPPDPVRFADLRARLAKASTRLPPLYRRNVLEPLQATLDEIGPRGFERVLRSDPDRAGPALVLLDLAQAVLQNGERYRDAATDGFQEVVSDLYDGFLSAEDRGGVKEPDHGVIPPLAKWGRPRFGPYTLPVEATAPLGLEMGVVSLPPANARAGLLAWAALGHETAGHDILGADAGLADELKAGVRAALRKARMDDLAEYWAGRIDETASDVMGILNMGPAAAVGLVGYFRGLNAAWGEGPHLRSDGPASDPHPADLVRGWLGAAVVRLLAFGEREAWAAAVEAETDRDAEDIRLAGRTVTPARAKRSAALVAAAVARGPMKSLEGHALGAIQGWSDEDQAVVARLRAALQGEAPIPERIQRGDYAAHAVAAAVTAAAARGGDPARLHGRLRAMLAAMHARNASWGPLPVVHPGDLAPHPATALAPALRGS